MPLTTVDAQPALVVIDLQTGIAPYAPESVIGNNAELAAAFRAKGHPVVLVNVVAGASGRTDERPDGGASQIPAEATELIDALGRADDDILITKETWGAFSNPALHEELQKRGVTQVFITGVATSIGCESTARQAHELGYHVVTVPDAMGDLTERGHDDAVEVIFPRLSQVSSTAEVLAAL